MYKIPAVILVNRASMYFCWVSSSFTPILTKIHQCFGISTSHRGRVQHTLFSCSSRINSSSLLVPTQGTVYEKTNAEVEMKKINREEFWEQAKVLEEKR